MFKGLSNLGVLMRQAQEMGGRFQQLQERLKLQRVTGQSGGGMAMVEANGLGQVMRVTIEPQLVEQNEREMIEDLVAAATNDALARAKQVYMESMKELAGGMDIPGLEGALEKLAGFDPAGS